MIRRSKQNANTFTKKPNSRDVNYTARKKRFSSFTDSFRVSLIIVFAVFWIIKSYWRLQIKLIFTTNSSKRSVTTTQSNLKRLKSPPTCNNDQLMKIRHQLPPESCIATLKSPYLQKCSFTVATKCPVATWLDDHYLGLQRRYYKDNLEQPPPFLGISIGCNKGFDAINTLRMGTFDESINKRDWNNAMEQDGEELHQAVCAQDDPEDVFEILEHYKQESSSSPPKPKGEMHCIEPMPQTFKRLKYSAESLGYEQKGFNVTNAAISKVSGEMLFQTGGMKKGVENIGLNNCAKGKRGVDGCEPVRVFSLKDFVDNHVKADEDDLINILSIDVEGFDGDVLLGATAAILKRVEYLEFEYNWMGSWKNQHLYDVTKMLDEDASMTCYFAGIDRLWRITNCWMSYFDIHAWSNIACVNRRLVPTLATKMEDIFQRTLEDERQWISFNPKKLEYYKTKFRDHKFLSTDPHLMTKKYG